MRTIFKFLMLAFCAAIGGSVVTILFHTGITTNPLSKADISYADFLSITLTALSLMITVLGFFVAAAGVIGWSTIENKLRDHSINYFKQELGTDGKLREEMETLIQELTYRGVENFKVQKGIEGGAIEEKPEGEYND